MYRVTEIWHHEKCPLGLFYMYQRPKSDVSEELEVHELKHPSGAGTLSDRTKTMTRISCWGSIWRLLGLIPIFPAHSSVVLWNASLGGDFLLSKAFAASPVPRETLWEVRRPENLSPTAPTRRWQAEKKLYPLVIPSRAMMVLNMRKKKESFGVVAKNEKGGIEKRWTADKSFQ